VLIVVLLEQLRVVRTELGVLVGIIKERVHTMGVFPRGKVAILSP
jgi:hypothetical protein